MIEDQEAFVVIECRVVVGEACVVPHSVERLHNADARLQDAFGHVRLDESGRSYGLHVLPKDAVQRLVPVHGNAASL